MTESQIAVFSGVLLLAAIALFLFLGYLWGQKRNQQKNQSYRDGEPMTEHDIELPRTAVRPSANHPSANHPTDDQPTETIPQPTVVTQNVHTNEPTMTTAESMTMTDLKVKSKLYHYSAHVTDVYDGDTITVDIDMGMGIWQRDVRIRFWRVNTSEVRGEEREQGLITRDFVRNLILDRGILLRTILDKRGQDRTGKYGRLLGEVLVEDERGRMINVNQLLLDEGMATDVAADGSRPAAPAAAPQPEYAESAAPQYAQFVACIHCGEVRSVDHMSGRVDACVNCFDAAYG